MTSSEFLTLCFEHNTTPELALENDAIVDALRARDDALVEKLMQEAL